MAELYLGIDLGTTNSVIAFGNLAKNGNLKCNIIELERRTEQSVERQKTLPSVVYYQKDGKTGEFKVDVGNYAKGRYGIKRGYVSKSVKSLMGINDHVGLAEEIPDKTPTEVSAQILRFMRTKAKARHKNNEMDDVVITVPASFGSSQCKATLEAARLAGINVDNVHDVLLYEPKAVIYDLVNMQESGEISSDTIDFETPKNILVFDLGGGTLDVTLHKVGYNENDIMSIEDLAISRYTNIGGDNFDRLIANDIMDSFEKEYGIKIPESRKLETLGGIISYAEKLKMDMSNDINEQMELYGEIEDDIETFVDIPFLYDSYGYSLDYSMSRVEQVVAPLLGKNLSLEDAKQIDKLNEKDVNNIIYPILDVLAKTDANIKIDAVILNGGMTRFFPIKKRIDEFFGFESLVTNDPDLSVARGAVYYHYLLHKYNIPRQALFQTTNSESEVEFPEVKHESADSTEQIMETGTILNDNINIGLAGEYLSVLAEAGTKLPFTTDEIKDKYFFGESSDSISLEIFLGRKKTKNLPNYRVGNHYIQFQKKYPENTPVSIRISIDSFRNMMIESWITNNRMDRAIISVDTNGKQVSRNKEISSKLVSNEMLELNPKSELNQLKTLIMQEDSKKKKDRIKQITSRISKASNKREFFCFIEENLARLSSTDVYRGYLYMAANSLAIGWNEMEKQQIAKCCKEHFSPSYYGIYANEFVLKHAICYILNWDKNGIAFAHQLIDSGRFESYIGTILETILQYKSSDYEGISSLIKKCPEDAFTEEGVKMLVESVLNDRISEFNICPILLNVADKARWKGNNQLFYYYLECLCKVIEKNGISNSNEVVLVHTFKKWMKNETSDDRYHITNSVYNAILSKDFSETIRFM